MNGTNTGTYFREHQTRLYFKLSLPVLLLNSAFLALGRQAPTWSLQCWLQSQFSSLLVGSSWTPVIIQGPFMSLPKPNMCFMLFFFFFFVVVKDCNKREAYLSLVNSRHQWMQRYDNKPIWKLKISKRYGVSTETSNFTGKSIKSTMQNRENRLQVRLLLLALRSQVFVS